ncbi:MAG: RsmB/NOP family class I SAM-dependent RNA methyltransferase [Acidimicrobiales bacterium]
MVDHRKRNRFIDRTAEALNLGRAEVEELFQGARATTARINVLHPTRSATGIEADLRAVVPSLQPVGWCPNTWRTDGPDGFSPAAPALLEDGRVYLQNASSLLPVVALDPRPGHRVLDVAAAPGGKAFHIAARTGNEGELWLNDGNPQRAARLGELAGVYGVRVTSLTSHPAQYLDKYLDAGETFDRILLDVQCSGEGRIDLRHGDALRFWSEARIEKYKHLQTKMLDTAYKLLRPGGVMVYSTCTVAPEENEYPVDKVLGRRPDLDLAPIAVDEPAIVPGRTAWRETRFDRRLARAVRVVPDGTFEAFFAAKLVRSS